MLSIVIADDEVGIIDLCKMLIEYPGASIIGEAHNGQELFRKIRELHPNTVITDICMPGMTGLELIETSRQAYPDVSFIVMSGYTDFEYAQTSLRFGVWDYLLKPLKKAELNRTLEKLDKSLEEKQSQSTQNANIREDLQESLATLQKQYIRDIWKSGTAAPVPMIGDKKVLDLSKKMMQCILLRVDSKLNSKSVDMTCITRQASSTGDRICKIAESACAEMQLVPDGLDVILLLVYAPDTADKQSRQLLKLAESELRYGNIQNNFVHVAASASLLMEGSPETLPELFSQARTALKWRLEKSQSSVILYDLETDRALDSECSFLNAKLSKTIEEVIGGLNVDAVDSTLREAWAACETDRPVPGTRYQMLVSILMCLRKAFDRLPGMQEMPDFALEDADYFLSDGYAPENILKQLTKSIREKLNLYQERVRNRENSMVRQAKQYVTQHFTENISLNQVARHVCLSPAYFSTLFKSETGQGFVEYLQHVRIVKAEDLLKNTKMRVGDIAQSVGYMDVKFFNKIFSKETTVTPSEYRKFYS